MPEKARFIVDSSGEAELQEVHGDQSKNPVLHIADIAMPLGETALSQEQIGDSKYFAEPGGRVIETETGSIVTHGDGSKKIPIQDIETYENRK